MTDTHALRPAASEGEGVDGGLRHGMNCPANSLAPWESDPCNCGLEWRIALETEKTMHAAWRKRAEEAESQLSAAPKPPQSPSDARHFAQIFERDRSTVAEAVTAIKKIISGYGWLRHGRGSYEYNDDRWHDEFGAAIDLIETALEPLKVLAGDVSDCPVDRAEIIAARQSPSLALAPIDMILFCPNCGLQHLDAPDQEGEASAESNGRETRWENPPHKSHLCHSCGHIWRPAAVPTNGVMQIETAGKADNPSAIRNYVNGKSLALAEENRVLREALDQLIKATTNLLIHVDTSTCGGALLTFYHEAKSAKDQARAALSTARPSAQAYRETFDEMLAALEFTSKQVVNLASADLKARTRTLVSVADKVRDALARAEACK